MEPSTKSTTRRHMKKMTKVMWAPLTSLPESSPPLLTQPEEIADGDIDEDEKKVTKKRKHHHGKLILPFFVNSSCRNRLNRRFCPKSNATGVGFLLRRMILHITAICAGRQDVRSAGTLP